MGEVVQYSFLWMMMQDVEFIVEYLCIVFVVSNNFECVWQDWGKFVIDVIVLCGKFIEIMIDVVCLYLGNCVMCYQVDGCGMFDGYYLLLLYNFMVGMWDMINFV